MSAFRLRKEAKSWFKEINDKNNLSIDFDLYYYCLMAGLAVNIKKDDFLVGDTSELIEYFPARYKEKSRIIVSIFLLDTLLRFLNASIIYLNTVIFKRSVINNKCNYF
jgi:hypothetical protein